jgi:hypothetical protein
VQLCRLWASLGRRYRAKGFWSNERSRLNAIRHGILSRHLVLPWEDRSEYDDLLESLVTEHRPNGPTEHHLVEELAGVISPPVSARWPQNSFTNVSRSWRPASRSKNSKNRRRAIAGGLDLGRDQSEGEHVCHENSIAYLLGKWFRMRLLWPARKALLRSTFS